MKISELKRFINKLPIEMEDYIVVNGEAKIDSDGTILMFNNGVYTIFIDQKNKEMQILHQSDEDIKEMLSYDNK